MITIARRIYYDKSTGALIYDTGERTGTDIHDTTIEEDFQYALELKDKNRESISYIQLSVGEYSYEFSNCRTFRVNPQTKILEFTLREEFENEITPTNPYEEQIETLNNRIIELEQMLEQVNNQSSENNN